MPLLMLAYTLLAGRCQTTGVIEPEQLAQPFPRRVQRIGRDGHCALKAVFIHQGPVAQGVADNLFRVLPPQGERVTVRITGVEAKHARHVDLVEESADKGGGEASSGFSGPISGAAEVIESIGRLAYRLAADASGYSEIWLHMRRSNIASRKAAEHAGFAVVDVPGRRQLMMRWRRSGS